MCLSARHRGSLHHHAPLSDSYLRRPARKRHRHGGPPFRAGATASATMADCCSSICATITASPRSWPIPTRLPSRTPRSCALNGWCGSTARCARVPPAPRIPNCRPVPIEVYISEIEVLGSRRRAADAGLRRPGIPRGYPAEVPLSRPAPRATPPQHHDARRGDRFDPAAHEGAGLLRVSDARS